MKYTSDIQGSLNGQQVKRVQPNSLGYFNTKVFLGQKLDELQITTTLASQEEFDHLMKFLENTRVCFQK